MKTLSFKNNNQMPALGLGTWKSAEGEVYLAVRTAIKIGYRHIDCAAIYGNEKEVGQALSDAIKEGDIVRQDIWVTSKLWNNAHEEHAVLPALKQTLADLQLDYLDLYLIHWPVAQKAEAIYPASGDDFYSLEDVPVATTWKALEYCKAKGLVRQLGVSNFSMSALKDLVANAAVKPEMNQVECHPFLQQKELLAYCQSEKIHLTAYSPLGSKDRPVEIKGENEPSLLEHPVIVKIAGNHKCSAAQVLIAWQLKRGLSVIPKSVNEQRLKENYDARKIRFSKTELMQIAELDKGFRYVDGSFWTQEGSPYTLGALWD